MHIFDWIGVSMKQDTLELPRIIRLLGGLGFVDGEFVGIYFESDGVRLVPTRLKKRRDGSFVKWRDVLAGRTNPKGWPEARFRRWVRAAKVAAYMWLMVNYVE